MANLKGSDIETLAKVAGFSGKDADIATAVALAESSGNPNAHKQSGRDDSYGLWQINMLGALGPDRRKRYSIGSNTDLFRPDENARVAYAIYKDAGHKFNSWSTYTNGAYKDHMGETEGLDVIPGSGGDSLRGQGLGDQFSGVTSAINNVGQNLFKGLADVVGVILAVVLLIGAIVILAMQSKTGKSAVKGVTKFI
jgi:hypothetical protein